MSKLIINKFSAFEAKKIALEGAFIERLRPVFYTTTSRQVFAPRI